MRQHLEEGCPQCAETYRFWQRLAGFMPPEDPAPRLASRSVRTAHLVFDTFAHRDVPSVPAEGRHLLYEALPFTIDLRIDAVAGPGELRLNGRIVDAERTGAWPQEARVTVNTTEAQVRSVTINERGEFECQIAGGEDVTLAVTPRDGELILVSLRSIRSSNDPRP